MSGIATDIAGNLYIAELDNRVQKFDKNGSYITQFNIPARNIAIDSSGNIYATVNNAVIKYNSDGALISTWGSTGTGNGQFSFPIGIALDKSGYIYVVDSENHRIQKFDSDGNYVTKWGIFGVGNGAFKAPTGIAIDNDSVYVSDMGNYRIQKFDLSGNYISKFGERGTGQSQFNSSVSVCVDASHNLYVSDYYNGRVVEYDKNFSYVTQYTGFDYPMGVVATSSSIYVIDSGNYRVLNLEQPKNDTNLTSAKINVMKSTPIITWDYPADIINGTPLSSTQLNASASVDGTFIYNPPSGTVLSVGYHILHVDFTPADVANYTTASKDILIDVLEQPMLLIANFSSNVTSGYPPLSVQFNDLSQNATGWNWDFGDGNNSTQQNPKHTYYTAGDYTVNLTATNANGANSTSTTINVMKSTPIITWDYPAGIINGTPLSSTQLNASASVDGTFIYNPPLGTVLSVGYHTLHVDFTPADVANYTTASKDVTINVSEQPTLPIDDSGTTTTSSYSTHSVQFNDLSHGDGVNSTQQNPMSTYSATGNDTINLTATNVVGSNTSTKSNFIKNVSNSGNVPHSGNVFQNAIVVFTNASPITHVILVLFAVVVIIAIKYIKNRKIP